MAYELSATAHDFAVVRDGETAYRLTGTVTATTTGWTIDAHPLNEGIVPQPEMARWLVHAIAPGEGDTVTFVVTDYPVDVAFEDEAGLKTVFVNLQGAATEDGDDAIELSVP